MLKDESLSTYYEIQINGKVNLISDSIIEGKILFTEGSMLEGEALSSNEAMLIPPTKLYKGKSYFAKGKLD